ncbi:hypothetical protein C8J57DRAFT_1545819 [Mycena rebaudengoi]|nr:hypothetical protein C8J57DRAFT_1545819 [Mycena rebaudengoi]
MGKDAPVHELLGPAKLPETPLFDYYKRLGDLCPDAWLKKYTRNGAYLPPPADGFQLSTDHLRIKGTELLRPGLLRPLPPGTFNLGMYRVYKVLKDLEVVSGR